MDESPITQILSTAQRGDPDAARELLGLVYEELRKLAAQRMAAERPDQTLQATALVHEAYIRLLGNDPGHPWNGRGHFFAAAAEAMRRILIDRARRRRRVRHGGDVRRVALDDLDSAQLGADDNDAAAEQILALDDALARLAVDEPAIANLVKLRYFAGLTLEQAAAAADVSLRTANRHWAFAKAWLYKQLSSGR